MILGVRPRLMIESACVPNVSEIWDLLHALPESFSLANLDNGVNCPVEFWVPAAHTHHLELSADNIKWMGEE